MCSHDSGEEFGQPGASFVAQVLQEFHVDVVVTWGCRWFRLLQSSWNVWSEWMGKTLVWHLLQKSSTLHTNLAFKLLVMRCFSNLDEMSGNGIGADWRMCWLVWLLSSTKPNSSGLSAWSSSFSLLGSHAILVFWYQMVWQYSDGDFPSWNPNKFMWCHHMKMEMEICLSL